MLSPQQVKLIADKDIIIRKKEAIDEIKNEFQNIEISIKEILSKFNLDPEISTVNGKISSGENYLGFPYLVLDYPRIFGKENIFAYRTMFWWGNFFSFTFLTSGKFLKDINTDKFVQKLSGKNFFRCINTSPFIHHFKEDNYQPLEAASSKHQSFFKVSRKLPLNRADQLQNYATETYEIITSALYEPII